MDFRRRKQKTPIYGSKTSNQSIAEEHQFSSTGFPEFIKNLIAQTQINMLEVFYPLFYFALKRDVYVFIRIFKIAIFANKNFPSRLGFYAQRLGVLGDNHFNSSKFFTLIEKPCDFHPTRRNNHISYTRVTRALIPYFWK